MRKLTRAGAWVMLVVSCFLLLTTLSGKLGLLGEQETRWGLKGGGLAALGIVTSVLFGLSRERERTEDKQGT